MITIIQLGMTIGE